MVWRLRVGTTGKERCGPSPHPPAEAGCPLSPAPPSGKPGPPFDTRPGPPSISALHLPTHSLPRTQTSSEARVWTGRVDRQTGHTSDSELMHTGLTQSSQDSQHPLGLAQPLPTPAAPWESVGIGTERKAVFPHLQERRRREGQGHLPHNQRVYVCVHSSVLCVTKRGSCPVPITDKWLTSCGPSCGGRVLSLQKDKMLPHEWTLKKPSKRGKPDTEGHTVCDSISAKCPERHIHRDRKQMVGARVQEGGGSDC